MTAAEWVCVAISVVNVAVFVAGRLIRRRALWVNLAPHGEARWYETPQEADADAQRIMVSNTVTMDDRIGHRAYRVMVHT